MLQQTMLRIAFILLLIPSGTINISISLSVSSISKFAHFSAVRSDVDGSALCANDTSVTPTIAVRTRLQCSGVCSTDDNCVAFNCRRRQNLLVVCEQFNFLPTSYANVADCVSYLKDDSSFQPVSQGVPVLEILMQQHFNGTGSFNRTWAEFKVGFGDPSGDYWIGNDRLHELTQDGSRKLRVDLQASYNGLWYWAEYSTFIVDDESTNYTLHIGGYNGTAGDAMTPVSQQWGNQHLDGMRFSTLDRDLSAQGCATAKGIVSGFWMNYCTLALVNSDNSTYGFSWFALPVPGSSTINNYGLLVSRLTIIQQ